MGERMCVTLRVNDLTSLSCSKGTSMAVDRWWFGKESTRMVVQSSLLYEGHKHHFSSVGKLLFHILCLYFKPMMLWFSNRTTPVRFQQTTHIKFLRKTMSQHLNVHLDISIDRLLNMCGTFLEGAFTPERCQQRSTLWGYIVGGVGQHFYSYNLSLGC